jgi:hypothetical protein
VDKLKIFACTICGEQRSGRPRWFLVAEDRWQDKLKILHWDDSLATREGIHCACSAAHLQQLVVHWMTTGSLDHPFAQLAFQRERQSCPRSNGPAVDDLRASGARQIGELSVHRESMQRVLSESPQSLQTILDALLSALQRDSPRPEPKIDWEDEAIRAAAREV